MEPWGCFVAEEGDGKIVGAAVAVMWGTLGLVGPVAVLPNYQNQDIGQQLLAACQAFFDENKALMQGSYLSDSPKHLSFYQQLRLPTARPGGITASRSTGARSSRRRRRSSRRLSVRRYSSLEEAKKKATLLKLHRITNGVSRGLDVGKEVEIVDGLALGDTVSSKRAAR